MEIPDFVLKRLGLEVARNQLLEEQLAQKTKEVEKLSDALEGEPLEVVRDDAETA